MPAPFLTPTLWRTCRVLANDGRLRLLAAVLARGRLSVSQAASQAAIPAPKASLGLRALQSRGLLAAARESRWVFYTPEPDPLVEHAAAVLAATRRALARSDAAEAMLRAFTAFTHPRRLAIVAALARRPMTTEALAGSCRFSFAAASRHLRKLARRGVLTEGPDGVWCLARCDNGLLRDLATLVVDAAAAPRGGRRAVTPSKV
jgi:DNA-binding transcriptional ArsR family regulator